MNKIDYKEEYKNLLIEYNKIKQELKFRKEIEKEAVRRYNRVANELLQWYIKYGVEGWRIDDNKGSKI